MSSTTIPNVIAATTDKATPTSPFKYPHKPKPIAAGNKFGIKLNKPSFTFFNAIINKKEIKIKAVVVPTSIESMFLLEKCENIIDKPVPCVLNSGNSLSK